MDARVAPATANLAAGPARHDRTWVALCVATYRRPVGLARLLEAVARLDVAPDTHVEVVVVDNDPDGTAQAVVEAARPSSRWPICYEIEPRRGIPHARNRAVALAGGAPFVGFLDDDETPRTDWLLRMVEVQRATGADVVMGRSIPDFESGVPGWVVDGRFFERPRHPTGRAIPYNYARTSGVLMSRAVLSGRVPPFDPSYAVSGGSDRHLFHQAALEGRRFVWADEAVVVESVPTTRATTRWLLARMYRTGNSRSLTMVALEGNPWRRAKRVAAGCYAMAVGLVRAAPALLHGRTALVAALREVAYGLGLVTGVFGIRAREYVTVHGS